jgi:hypothetical protein
MYQDLFQRLFNVITLRLGRPIRWQHLHGDGFAAVISDMDAKQVTGKRFQSSY